MKEVNEQNDNFYYEVSRLKRERDAANQSFCEDLDQLLADAIENGLDEEWALAEITSVWGQE